MIIVSFAVAETKRRWRNLRASYGRFSRNLLEPESPGSGSPSTKKMKSEYYLKDKMSFLDPYMKHMSVVHDPDNTVNQLLQSEGIHASVLHDPDNTGDQLQSEEICIDDAAVDAYYEEEEDQYDDSRDKRSVESIPEISLSVGDAMLRNVSTATESRQDMNDDADLNFFKSLLPDFKLLPAPKKRKFKMEVLQLLNNYHDEIDANSILPAHHKLQYSLPSSTIIDRGSPTVDPLSCLKQEGYQG